MTSDKEWVRNHRISGYVAGRFQGEYEGKPREILVLQTTKGTVLVPAGSTLPISKQDVISQTALDLGPVIDAMLEGGLTIDDAETIWQMAIERKRHATSRFAENRA